MNSENIIFCHHPLLFHHMAIVRDKATPQELFRCALKRVSQLVLYEATKNLAICSKVIETPLANCATVVLSEKPIIVAPILRAGLCMAEVMVDLIPTASIYHLGLYRDPTTLKPVIYYNKLHEELNYADADIFILDPMLATGGSVNQAIEIFKGLGVNDSNIKVACLIAAPEGINAVHSIFPNTTIIVGVLDSHLNEKAYVIPGLGDAGDRAFGTSPS